MDNILGGDPNSTLDVISISPPSIAARAGNEYRVLCDSHSQFSSLSFELRVMIWEFTWPEPQMIEAAVHEIESESESESDSDHSGTEFSASSIAGKRYKAILRPAGPLSTLIRSNFCTRGLTERRKNQVSFPVALHICRESRNYTQRQYRIMTHRETGAGDFYYRPALDVFFFARILAGEHQDRMCELERCYHKQLNEIENVLIDFWDFAERGYAAFILNEYLENCLPRMEGPKRVVVVDDPDEKQMARVLRVYGDYEFGEVDKRASNFKAQYANSVNRGGQMRREWGKVRNGWSRKGRPRKGRLGNGRAHRDAPVSVESIQYIDRNGKCY